jgi:signal transduction histidine kinase
MQNPDLAHWLELQSTICTRWIARVYANPPNVSGRRLAPPGEAQLRLMYAHLCAGLAEGYFTAFDESVAKMTRDGHAKGYRLIDLLDVVIALKDQIWETLLSEFSNQAALAHMQALGGPLDNTLRQAARVYHEEVQSKLATDLERAQGRLSELDRAKSTFLNIAAHELKTPLTLIQGYSDILISELAEGSNERAATIADGLASGAKRLQQIVDDMIAVSMIDSQALALHLQPTSIAHILHVVIHDLKVQIEQRQIDLQIESFPAVIEPIYVDPQRLYDAFTHIVSNSIKFTPDPGRVTLSAHVIGLKEGEEQVIEILVADNGIGIAPEKREQIFEKFYGPADSMHHSSGRTKFKGGGPGLGLAVAKGIIEAHGGKIWAESPGHSEEARPGTTFHILLPMHVKLPEARGRLRLGLDSDDTHGN